VVIGVPCCNAFFLNPSFIPPQAMTCISNIRWCCPPFFVSQWVVIDIGGIVYRCCFNFLFITLYDHYPNATFQPSNIKTMYISETLFTWHYKNNQLFNHICQGLIAICVRFMKKYTQVT
jgi:hypothetical protein